MCDCGTQTLCGQTDVRSVELTAADARAPEVLPTKPEVYPRDATMAGDTSTELLFIDTFKHQNAEVMSHKPQYLSSALSSAGESTQCMHL